MLYGQKLANPALMRIRLNIVSQTENMSSFFIAGECSDPGYRNVRDGDHSPLIEGRTFTESLWNRYAPLADSHCRQDARAHFIERFWEMYLAVALVDRGFDLVRGTGTGPEFSFNQGDRQFWAEAVAPGPGSGADRVHEIELGVAYSVPTEKILLRFANAVAEKRGRYHAALKAGIVTPDSGYLLAINSRRIPHAPYGNTLLFYLQALLPVGDLTLMLNRSTREIEDRFYASREKVLKTNSAPVSTQPLLNPDFGFISAVLHSAVDCVNRPTGLGEDFSVLHNPLAVHPFDPSTFDWCDQYFYFDGTLEKRLANTGLQPTAAGGIMSRCD